MVNVVEPATHLLASPFVLFILAICVVCAFGPVVSGLVDEWLRRRVDRMVDDWERHVADAVALNERTVYEQTLADFTPPPLFLDEDAGHLMADEAEAWLRGEAS